MVELSPTSRRAGSRPRAEPVARGRPGQLGLGHRVGRHRQDPGARRPGAAPAARRQRAAADPLPDLHQGGGGRDGGARPGRSRPLRDPARAPRWRGAAAAPRPAGERQASGTMRARLLAPRARPAVRPADHDDPRLLPVAAQALSAGGGRAAAFRRDRSAQRGRPDARGAGGGAGEPAAPIQADLATLAVLLGEATLAEGLAALREQRLRLGALSAPRRRAERVIAALYGALGLPAGATPETVRARGLRRSRDRPGGAARRLPRARQCGSDKDGARARGSSPPGSPPTSRAACDALGATTNGLPDAKTGRPGSSDASPSQCRRPRRRSPRCWPSRRASPAGSSATRRRRRRAHGGAAAGRRGGARALRAAQSATLAALDYDDLIERAGASRADRASASWVQYKLDQQIDHLLVDEGPGHQPGAVGDHRGAVAPSSSPARARGRCGARCSWSATRSSRS